MTLSTSGYVAGYDVDAAIDAYRVGWDAFNKGMPCPTDKDGFDGWNDSCETKKVVVYMVPRLEGYYHTNPKGD